MKPILCLDFDGVLHSYTSGWQGIDVIPDPPVPDAKEFVEAALEHFRVAIYSGRSRDPRGIRAMISYLDDWDFPILELEFPVVKPAAFIALDDRTMLFEGNFPDPQSLLDFKTWYEEEH